MTITYTDPLIPCGLPHTTPSITELMLSTTSVQLSQVKLQDLCGRWNGLPVSSITPHNCLGQPFTRLLPLVVYYVVGEFARKYGKSAPFIMNSGNRL